MEIVNDKRRALLRKVADYMVAGQFDGKHRASLSESDEARKEADGVIAQLEWAHEARESLARVRRDIARTNPDTRALRETR